MSACPEALRVINSDYNERVGYCTDMSQYGKPEFWEVATTRGDCEDYALAKYNALYRANVPVSALRLATCWCEDGGYHAVLLVDTADQTWVLDNRYPLPMEYDLLPYKWDKIQIAGTNRWEKA